LKIVVAMDSFKGGLSAPEASEAVAAGLRRARPEWDELNVELKPMADGGEGTAQAILRARSDGRWIACEVAGPTPPQTVDAGYAWFEEDQTAVVEMASANGLPLLRPGERNPTRTSTLGTGQLIASAAEKGARQIMLAIGGSATCDGGIGAAAALGWRFLDEAGSPVHPVGGQLQRIRRIEPPLRPLSAKLAVLCDVNNPLCGPNGAARVYGPQKGATPKMVEQLDAGLAHLADLVRERLGLDLADRPGAGAAGGLGAGAVAFLGGTLSPGVRTLINLTRLTDALEHADHCLTGEGSFDEQSLQGKVVSGVAEAASRANVPVVVIAGRVRVAPQRYRRHGIRTAWPTHEPDMPMAEVVRREAELLAAAAERWLRAQASEP